MMNVVRHDTKYPVTKCIAVTLWLTAPTDVHLTEVFICV